MAKEKKVTLVGSAKDVDRVITNLRFVKDCGPLSDSDVVGIMADAIEQLEKWRRGGYARKIFGVD